MSVIRTSIFTVIKRFPERKDAITRLYMDDKNFQDICDDYRKCLEACKYWNVSASKEASARRQEYAMLRGQLETEIKQRFAESNNN